MVASKSKKNYEIDMCNGPIVKKMLLFALPLMGSGMLQLFFNAADIIVVGAYCGENSIAAVGSNSSLINLLTNMFIGLSIGTNVLAAQFYGSGNKKRLEKTVHTSVALGVISGIVLTIIGLFGANTILGWMSCPEDVIDLASSYLRIYFLGMTGTMVYNFASAILRAVGDTRRPLYYLTASGIINVLLNLLLVIKFDLNVAGVGIASAVSQWVSAILVIRCLLKEEGAIRFIPCLLRIDKDTCIRIIKIGLPAGLQGVVFSLSNVIIQSSINSFGSIVVAGNSAAQTIEGFVYFAMNAFSQATLSFTSQNMGAGKIDRIRKVLIAGICMVTVVGLALGGAVVLFRENLLLIYSDGGEFIAAGSIRLIIICLPYFTCGIMEIFVGSIRGMGHSLMPMITSVMGACVLRIIWIMTVFQMDMFHTPRGLYWTYPVSWVITTAAHFVCYKYVYKRVKSSNMAIDIKS